MSNYLFEYRKGSPRLRKGERTTSGLRPLRWFLLQKLQDFIQPVKTLQKRFECTQKRLEDPASFSFPGNRIKPQVSKEQKIEVLVHILWKINAAKSI